MEERQVWLVEEAYQPPTQVFMYCHVPRIDLKYRHLNSENNLLLRNFALGEPKYLLLIRSQLRIKVHPGVY